jgi:hypothetical protein
MKKAQRSDLDIKRLIVSDFEMLYSQPLQYRHIRNVCRLTNQYRSYSSDAKVDRTGWLSSDNASSVVGCCQGCNDHIGLLNMVHGVRDARAALVRRPDEERRQPEQ